jgi:hypothetical protein
LTEGKATVVVRTMRRTSLAKWLFAFLTAGLLSSIFLERTTWWDLLIGSVYAFAATLGMASVLAIAARRPPFRRASSRRPFVGHSH